MKSKSQMRRRAIQHGCDMSCPLIEECARLRDHIVGLETLLDMALRGIDIEKRLVEIRKRFNLEEE